MNIYIVMRRDSIEELEMGVDVSKPIIGELGMTLDAWLKLREALVKIDREVAGCGPNVSKDFLRLALNSVRDIARSALGQAPKG